MKKQQNYKHAFRKIMQTKYAATFFFFVIKDRGKLWNNTIFDEIIDLTRI